jgi:outer membrane protein assembly factor BamB
MLAAAVVLALAFLALAAYHRVNRDRYRANEALLSKLRGQQFSTSAVPPALAGDWPQWRGPRRDGISTETGLLDRWPAEGPPEIWRAEVGPGYSSMAVAQGKVLTQYQEGIDAVVVCFDAGTGKLLWRRNYPCPTTGDSTYGPRPRSTPTVDGNRVYVQGGNGLLLCLDFTWGKVVWQRDLHAELNAPLPQWGFAGSPLIEGDMVFVLAGGPGCSVAALNKNDGKTVWTAGNDPLGYSSPIVRPLAGRPQLLGFTGSSLLGIAPDTGQVLWRYPWDTSYNCNVATPIVRGDYVLISSGYGKGCALLQVTAGGTEPVYEHNRMCNHFSSSILVGEHIYGFSDDRLRCMDFRSGEVLWNKSGFGRGTLLAADGKLVVLGENGRLVLADAAPEAWRERSSFRFSTERCWNAPVLAQGKLYVRDEEKLVCYNLKR